MTAKWKRDCAQLGYWDFPCPSIQDKKKWINGHDIHAIKIIQLLCTVNDINERCSGTKENNNSYLFNKHLQEKLWNWNNIQYIQRCWSDYINSICFFFFAWNWSKKQIISSNDGPFYGLSNNSLIHFHRDNDKIQFSLFYSLIFLATEQLQINWIQDPL